MIHCKDWVYTICWSQYFFMESSEIHLGFNQEWKYPDTRHTHSYLPVLIINKSSHDDHMTEQAPCCAKILSNIGSRGIANWIACIQASLRKGWCLSLLGEIYLFLCISVEWHNSLGQSTLYIDDDFHALMLKPDRFRYM